MTTVIGNEYTDADYEGHQLGDRDEIRDLQA